jgi:hypothetical protein
MFEGIFRGACMRTQEPFEIFCWSQRWFYFKSRDNILPTPPRLVNANRA